MELLELKRHSHLLSAWPFHIKNNLSIFPLSRDQAIPEPRNRSTRARMSEWAWFLPVCEIEWILFLELLEGALKSSL